jgi:hypothetical protein
MNIEKWFQKRGLRFIIQRASILLNRYGITPARAKTRIEDSLTSMARFGFSPTLFTPGVVVKRYSRFIQSLQSKGAEIAVHSYQHIDLNSMKVEDANGQLNKAILIYKNKRIEAHGFRCPYLSCSEELLDSVSAGLFSYSSNRAIWLELPHINQKTGQSVIFNTLRKFYNPKSFAETICIPRFRSKLIEIPVCVPDDLQLHDGLNLDSEGISQAWIEMLHQTYQRGELFNLIFHPELGSVCEQSFIDLLGHATQLKPGVWVARLCDIGDWWREKSGFSVNINSSPTGLQLSFVCSPRATILVRGLDTTGLGQIWEGTYYRLRSNTLIIPEKTHPFVGIDTDIPEGTISFLRNQGYLLENR